MPMLFEPPEAPFLVQIICTKMAILAQIKFRITRRISSANGCVDKKTAPGFSTSAFAGTEGEFETETVIPLELLNEQYDKITDPKAMARRTGTDHDHMMYSAGGYVMAWFRWRLQNDAEAAKAFTGDDPELLNNPLYQDQRINLGE